MRVCSRVLWWTESWASLSWARGNSDLRICSVCVCVCVCLGGSLFREEYKKGEREASAMLRSSEAVIWCNGACVCAMGRVYPVAVFEHPLLH